VDLGIVDGAEERLMNILEEERLERLRQTSSAGGVLTYNPLTDFDWGGLYHIVMNQVDKKSSKY
jgi:hypothetical protein